MGKIPAFIVIFLAGLAFGLVLTHGTLNAQDAGYDSGVISKLDNISKSQQELITAINSMKEDIQIIKVRVTQLQ